MIMFCNMWPKTRTIRTIGRSLFETRESVHFNGDELVVDKIEVKDMISLDWKKDDQIRGLTKWGTM